MSKVVGVFGLPCSGKTTVIEALIQSSRELLTRISSGDIARKLSTDAEMKHMAEGNLFSDEDKLRSEILSAIEQRKQAHTIILDGFPRHASQIIFMCEQMIAGTKQEGCFVQVYSEFLENRAKLRNRGNDDNPEALKLKIDKQQREITKMDKLIAEMALPYYTIINDDLTAAVKQFAKILGLKK